MKPEPGRPFPSRDLKIALLLGGIVFSSLAPFHRNGFTGSDENGVYEITRSLAEEGDLTVREVPNSAIGASGRRYSQYAPGQAFLALPFYLSAGILRPILPPSWVRALAGPGVRSAHRRYQSLEVFLVLIYPVFMTGVLVSLFYLFQRRLRVSPFPSLLTSLLLGLTTHAALMSTFFLRHTTEAVFLLGAMFFLHEFRRSGRWTHLAAGCFLGSWIVLIRQPAVVAAAGLLFYWVLLMHERGWFRKDRTAGWRVLPASLLPPLLAGMVWIFLQAHQWGSPLGSPFLRHLGHFSNPLHVGLFGFLFSPGMSIFLFSPLLALLPWTYPVLFSRHRGEALAILILSLTSLFFFAKFDYWTGLWSAPGPRYLFTIVPLLMLPLGPWLDRRPGRGKWIAVGGLAIPGLLVQLAFMGTSFSGLSSGMGYRSWEPELHFLFLPDQAPVLHAARALLRLEWNDTWIVSLIRGWPGQEPHPIVAGVLVFLWIGWLRFLAGALHRVFLPGTAPPLPPVPRLHEATVLPDRRPQRSIRETRSPRPTARIR